MAENSYAHPLYCKGIARYHRLFDIYSLGVVLDRLVETGPSWAFLQTDHRKKYGIPDTLIERCNDKLGPILGGAYRDVVQCCLQGDFPAEWLRVEDEPELEWETLRDEEIAVLEARDNRISGDLMVAYRNASLSASTFRHRLVCLGL